jgi:hypothetical protein
MFRKPKWDKDLRHKHAMEVGWGAVSQEPCQEVESEAARARKGAKEPLQGVRDVSVRAEGPQKVRWRILGVASDSRAEIPGPGRG